MANRVHICNYFHEFSWRPCSQLNSAVRPHRESAPSNRRRGFSMLELLVVMGILSVMMVAAIPAISSLSGANRINTSATKLALTLEQAYRHAVAQRTYVWVGFNESKEGNAPKLVITVVAGKTGASTDLSSNNLLSLARPLIFENLSLANEEGLEGMIPEGKNISTSTFRDFKWRVKNSELTFGKVIEFSPKGGVKIEPDKISRCINISLQENSAVNTAALQIAGLTGNVRVFRK